MNGKKTHGASRKPGKGKIKRSHNLLTALLAVAVLGAGGWIGYSRWVPEPDPLELPPEAVARGEGLFQKNCAVCHGVKGVAENPAEIRGGAKPGGGYWAPALNGTAHVWHHAPDVLFRIVKEGSPVPDSPMRGWNGRMNDEEIRSVLAYLRSLWPETVRARYRRAFADG